METPTNTVSNAAALGMDARIRGFAFIWLVLLLLAAYHTVLRNIAATWFDEYYNMEHGMLVPLAAGYMVWLKWETGTTRPASPSKR